MRGARSSMPRTRPAPASAGVIRFSRKSGRTPRSCPLVLLIEGVLDQLGVDPAEVGDAGAGAVRGQLHSQRAAEGLDSGLGDRVGRVAHAVGEGIDGRDDDHLAAALEICGSAARTVRQTPSRSTSKTRSHSSPEMPLAVANCFLGDAGVGDRHIEPAELLDHLGDGGEHGVLVGHVAAQPDCPRADPLGRFARLLGVEVEYRDRGSAQMHLPRRLEADSAGRAGDECDFAVEVVGRHGPGAYSQTCLTLGLIYGT